MSVQNPKWAFLRAVFAVVFVAAGVRSSWGDGDRLPSTGEFMAMLNTCAAGSRSEFEGDLLGSIEKMYQKGSTKGKAEFRSEAEFLRHLPERHKFEGYRLYVECIKAIMNDPVAGRAKAQSEFLQRFELETPVAKIKEFFGEAVKSRELYSDSGRVIRDGHPLTLLEFAGVETSLFVAASKNGQVWSAGIAPNDPNKGMPVSYIHMGNNIGGKDLSFYKTSDFQLWMMGELCQTDSLNGYHARFLYRTVTDCYFGAPGGYQTFVFAFQPTPETKCSSGELTKETVSFSSIRCKSFRSLRPALVVFSPDPADIADIILEWRYGFH